MNNDTRLLIIGIGLFIIVVATASLGGCHEVNETDRTAIKAGLVQKQAYGRCGFYWSKP